MGYSIIGRCARSGQIGSALASVSLAGGASLDAAVRANSGAVLIQGVRSFRLNRLATHLLGLGHSAAHVLQELKSSDPDAESRQIAIVDSESTIATHSGSALRGWSGVRVGAGYAVLCEHAAGPQVADAMAKAFEAEPDSELDHRMLCALEAGAAAEGAPAGLPIRSSALVAWGRRDYSDIDIRVDLHEQPVQELRRIYADFKPSAVYYEERARNPSQALSAREFAGIVMQKRTQAA